MFFSSCENLMLVNERVLIIYPFDLFSVEFSSGISTVLKHYKPIKFQNIMTIIAD